MLQEVQGRKYLCQLVNGVERDMPALGRGIRKWIPHLHSSVSTVSNTTCADYKDVSHDVFVSLIEAGKMYPVDLYRYRGRLYESDLVDGQVMRLKTPRCNRSAPKRFWASVKDVQKVKKARLSSVLYYEINHKCCDMITDYFRPHRGWGKELQERRAVKVKCGKAHTEVREVLYAIRTVQETPLDDAEVFVENRDNLFLMDLKEKLLGKLQGMSREILSELLEDSDLGATKVARNKDLPYVAVLGLRKEVSKFMRT